VCADGTIYVIAGGAPEYVSSWTVVGGEQSCFTIDPADITNAGTASPWNHLNAYPSNGTFLEDATAGTAYEAVGGFALLVDSCTTMAGCPGEIGIDPTDIANAGGAVPWNHLTSEPSTDSTVEDTATSAYWALANGCRNESVSSATAVPVDAAMLAEIPACPTIPPAPGFQSLVARKGSFVIRVRSVSNPQVPIVTYEYSLNAGKTWLGEPSKDAPMIVVRFLADDQAYGVTLRAVGAKGPSAPSKVILAKTL
jgi:hypothetical protein